MEIRYRFTEIIGMLLCFINNICYIKCAYCAGIKEFVNNSLGSGTGIGVTELLFTVIQVRKPGEQAPFM